MKVSDLVNKLAKQGIRLSRADLRELKLEFSSLSIRKLFEINDSMEAGLVPIPPQTSSCIDALKKQLRASKGKMSAFLPYLAAAIADRVELETLPKSATDSLVSLFEFSITRMSEDEFAKLGQEAFCLYKRDYDVSYQIKTG